MSGKWVQRRGVVYIPVAPGSGGAPAISGATVSVQPGGTMTVPPYQFKVTASIAFPLPQPSLVQIASKFSPSAPKNYMPGRTTVTRKFKAGHWTATRPFANFAFCPGTPVGPGAVGAANNPNCLTAKSEGQTAPAGSGKAHGLIRYQAGPAAYGGTMHLVSHGGGAISFMIGATGPTIMHNPFGGATGAAPTEAPGGPYASTGLTDVLPGGPITVGAVLSPYGMVQTPGVPNGYYGTTATWFMWGFPWTTGKVYINGTNAGPYTSTVVTLTGSRNVTAEGAGNITLVAGGIANGLHSGFTYMAFDYVQMKLSFPVNPMPSMSPAGPAPGAAARPSGQRPSPRSCKNSRREER
ncbi:MAG: hypothetical protein JRS35_22255 [Deltaproteobacteria bacterium]|nr:hypothetical protein [Deltaproteobacteria bacterium]